MPDMVGSVEAEALRKKRAVEAAAAAAAKKVAGAPTGTTSTNTQAAGAEAPGAQKPPEQPRQNVPQGGGGFGGASAPSAPAPVAQPSPPPAPVAPTAQTALDQAASRVQANAEQEAKPKKTAKELGEEHRRLARDNSGARQTILADEQGWVTKKTEDYFRDVNSTTGGMRGMFQKYGNEMYAAAAAAGWTKEQVDRYLQTGGSTATTAAFDQAVAKYFAERDLAKYKADFAREDALYDEWQRVLEEESKAETDAAQAEYTRYVQEALAKGQGIVDAAMQTPEWIDENQALQQEQMDKAIQAQQARASLAMGAKAARQGWATSGATDAAQQGITGEAMNATAAGRAQLAAQTLQMKLQSRMQGFQMAMQQYSDALQFAEARGQMELAQTLRDQMQRLQQQAREEQQNYARGMAMLQQQLGLEQMDYGAYLQNEKYAPSWLDQLLGAGLGAIGKAGGTFLGKGAEAAGTAVFG